MTPEEKAVIQAAITWRRQLSQLFAAQAGSIPDRDLAHSVDELMASRVSSEDEPAWKPATFADLLPGDRARIGQEETTVTRASRGPWHVSKVQDGYRLSDGTHVEKWEPGAQRWYPGWEHEELRIDFTVNPGMKVYPPDVECEILCDAERAALLLLQRGFPGSTVVS